MAIFFDAEVTPDALTAFVRELPTPDDLAFYNTIGSQFVDDHKVNFSELIETNRVASFRTWDGNFPTLGRDSASSSEATLMPLGVQASALGEYERLQLQFARTAGTNKAALANAIYNDAEVLTRSIYNRLELAWGDVLTDGILTVRENGIAGNAGVADFGMDPARKVNAATSWDDPAALILDDLIAWTEAYETDGVGAPGAIRMKLKTFRKLARNTQIVGLAVGRESTRERITLDEVRSVLDAEGLPPVVFLPDTSFYVENPGTGVPAGDQKVVPDNLVLLTPANLSDLGFTALGVSPTSLELVNSKVAEMTFQGAAGLVGVVEKVGPPYRQFTFVDAVAMPILTQPRRLFIARV
jgi:hypothetical protein